MRSENRRDSQTQHTRDLDTLLLRLECLTRKARAESTGDRRVVQHQPGSVSYDERGYLCTTVVAPQVAVNPLCLPAINHRRLLVMYPGFGILGEFSDRVGKLSFDEVGEG